MKELWLRAHEELVAEYMDTHPGVCWTAAYELTSEFVDDYMRAKLEAAADYWKTVKEQR